MIYYSILLTEAVCLEAKKYMLLNNSGSVFALGI